MIDLSKFVDKQVRVTFRNGCICEGKVLLNTTKSQITNPYYFKNTQYECGYTKDGFELDCTEPTAGDITHIEEIKSMKYEELEKKVAEMQKEIDRLKREDEKYPDLKPVEITRTVRVTPEQYIGYCKENDEYPTVEGYKKYYSCWKKNWYRFVDKDTYTQEIKEVEN